MSESESTAAEKAREYEAPSNSLTEVKANAVSQWSACLSRCRPCRPPCLPRPRVWPDDVVPGTEVADTLAKKRQDEAKERGPALPAHPILQVGQSISRSLSDLKRALTRALKSSSSDALQDDAASHKPPEPLVVYIGTWNMNGRLPPPTDIRKFLEFYKESQAGNGPNLLVIGTQECERPLEQAVFYPYKEVWERTLKETYTQDSFVSVGATQLGGLHLAIYARSSTASRISNVSLHRVPTGEAGLGNKGAVALSLLVDGSASILFVNSHLAAGQSKVLDRNSDYERIERGLLLSPSHETRMRQARLASDSVDVCFWLGDLNYRVDFLKEGPEGPPSSPSPLLRTLLSSNRLEVLLDKDQLSLQLQRRTAFHGFREPPIKFPPTYKFQSSPSQDSYATHRTPSWTDRILFKRRDVARVVAVRPAYYEALMNAYGSDHRPVVGSFVVHFP